MKTPDTQAEMETIPVFTVFLCMYWFLWVSCVSDLADYVWRLISHFVDGAVFYLYRSHLQWVFQPGPQHFLLAGWHVRPNAEHYNWTYDITHTHTHTSIHHKPKDLTYSESLCLCVERRLSNVIGICRWTPISQALSLVLMLLALIR